VAEKPSIAEAIANGLSSGNNNNNNGNNNDDDAVHFSKKILPVYESQNFQRGGARLFSRFSHDISILGIRGSPPLELFQAPIVRKLCKGSIVKHLQDEAKGCDFIVLWMDCDRYVRALRMENTHVLRYECGGLNSISFIILIFLYLSFCIYCIILLLLYICCREGENINFEVLDCCMHLMKNGGGVANYDRVYRAYFSAINPSDIQKAYQELGKPDKNQALSVDARQE
jgi:DNA topoisomerase-3